MPPGIQAAIEAKIIRLDAVADAALGDQLAHPHEKRGAGGERDHDQHHVAEVELADDAGAADAGTT